MFPREISHNPQRVAALAVVGPILGGLPSPATLSSVMFQGLADPLTFQLTLLKNSIPTGISPQKIHQATKFTAPLYLSALALYADPTCLNVVPLKMWIEESLFDMTGSSRVLKLIQMDITSKGEILANDLFTMEPKSPWLMSYLFTKNNGAYGLLMLDKFQKSSTVIGISQNMSMKSIPEESKKFRDQLVRSILAPNTKRINIMDYLTPCSVEGANKLRTATSGAELH